MTFGPVKHMLKPHPNSVSRNQFSPGRGPELRLRVRTQNHKSPYRISQDGLKNTLESFRKILSIWRARDNRFRTSGMYECSKGKLWKLSCVQGKGNSNACKLQIKAILRLELRTIGYYSLFIPNKKPSISTSAIFFPLCSGIKI